MAKAEQPLNERTRIGFPGGRKLALVATILIAMAVVSAFSIMYFRSAPPVHTIQTTISEQIPRGNTTRPGFAWLLLPTLQQGDNWAVQVTENHPTVVDTPTSLCVLYDGVFKVWQNAFNATDNPGSMFPWDQCLPTPVRDAGYLADYNYPFQIRWSGNWDLMVLSDNTVALTVKFSPANLACIGIAC